MANPVVKIRPVRRDGRQLGYVIWCLTSDECEFAEHVFLKTDAQAIQRGHTRDHRNGRTARAARPRGTGREARTAGAIIGPRLTEPQRSDLNSQGRA